MDPFTVPCSPSLLGPYLAGCKPLCLQTFGDGTCASLGRRISEPVEELRSLLRRSRPEGDYGGAAVRSQQCLLTVSGAIVC